MLSASQSLRFLQEKNPWSHLQWKPRFCVKDKRSWTPEILNVDTRTAQKIDNGNIGRAWPTWPAPSHPLQTCTTTGTRTHTRAHCRQERTRVMTRGIFWITWEDLRVGSN
ncbi:hypothetical protein XELAEV_18000403mg [Xenopus laevis]|uniref:Uncharacterized protein n=1 Tax=Xenopus laevis TaxID=8355 RepID=A0A974BQP5_XENLA|nr:hypothetical protein XELAEV_18000403mg [Xenopus laevis]